MAASHLQHEIKLIYSTRNASYIIMFLSVQNMQPLCHILGTFLAKDGVNKAILQIQCKTEGRPFSHLLIDLHPLTASLNQRMRLNITDNVMETIQIL